MGLWKHKSAEELQAAFDSLFLENEKTIYNLAWRLTGDADASDDIVQKTFLTLHTKIVEVLNHSNPKGWLFQTAHYYILHYQREQAHKGKYEVPLELAEQIAAPTQVNELGEFLDSLPDWVDDMDRKLLVLYYYYGYTLLEIAEKVGLAYGALRSRMARLLKKLAEYGFGQVD